MIDDVLGGLDCDQRVLVSFACGVIASAVICLFLLYVSRSTK